MLGDVIWVLCILCVLSFQDVLLMPQATTLQNAYGTILFPNTLKRLDLIRVMKH